MAMALQVPMYTVDDLARFPDDGNRYELAVEVLSRSSRIYDREFKRDAYFALGVDQVWLVDWREAEVEVFRSPKIVECVRATLEWRTPADITVQLDLSEVFAGL